MFSSSWVRKWWTKSSANGPVARRPRDVRIRPRIERLEDRCLPSAGQLDPTFGTGGIVNTNIGGPTPTAAKAVVVTQTDGKVVVAGSSSDYFGGTGNRIAVVRYNTNGSLDSSFGSGGQVLFQFTPFSSNDSPAGVALDASGHILVAGSSLINYSSTFSVARLNSDGTLDSNFGSGGTVILPYFAQSYIDTASSVALDGSGHIVLAGTATGYYTGSQFAVARLNNNGSLDSTFGTGGETTVSYAPGSFHLDTASSMALDPSGHIVVAGSSRDSYSNPHLAVTRLNSDGSLDSSFGSGGKAILPYFGMLGYEADSAAGVALDATGHIVVAGSASGYLAGNNYTTEFAVARLNGDGSLDNSFGSGGKTTISFSTGGPLFYESDNAAGVALDSSGHILVAGSAYGYSYPPYSFHQGFAVTRLNADGSLDTSFGSGGKAILSHFSPGSNYENDYGAGVAIDASGRAVVAGTAYTYFSSSPVIAVTRLGTDGNLDATWGNGGSITTAIPGASNDSATNMSITQPDGKIIVVGTSQAVDPYYGIIRLAVTRYNPDGSLDGTFGSGGKAVFDYNSGLFLYPSALSVDGSGRILVAGGSSAYYNGSFVVLRLNADGSPDTNFGQGGRATLPNFGTGGFFTDAIASGVAVDSSGHVVLAGTAFTSFSLGGGAGPRFAAARLNADGTLDRSFGTGGETIVNYGTQGPNNYEYDIAAGVAVDASGHIVVAGTASGFIYDQFHNQPPSFAVTRLNGDGSPDQSFGSGGKTTFSFGTPYEYDSVAGVALDASGRIVVAGNAISSYLGTKAVAVARLNPANGSLDQSFGTGGESLVSNFGPNYFYGANARGMAIDSAGRIAVVGPAFNSSYYSIEAAVALFKANGCPDVDFGLEGKVTTVVGSTQEHLFLATNAGFDSAGRLIVAGTTYSSPDQPHGNFALIRYLPHDQVIEAGSATFAGDLQAAVTALRTTPPAGTPRVVIHVASMGQMAAIGPAVSKLSVNPSGPEIEVLLDVDPGSYSPLSVSVPAGLKLILDGDDGAGGTRTLSGAAAPALTVSGDVLIRGGMAFSASGASALVVQGGQVNIQNASITESGNAPAIVVQGGQVTMRNSTVTETTTTNQAAIAISGGQVNLGTSYSYSFNPDPGNNTINVTGPGVLIRLTGPNDVMAVGDTFIVNGNLLGGDPYQIEDAVGHSLDGLGGGTIYWVPNNVWVTQVSGSIQCGVNVIPAGGTVNVQNGVKGPYSVGSKLLTIAYQSGLTITQQADTLDATMRELVVSNVYYIGLNSIKFVAGTNPGEVQLNINNLPNGTFLPTGRLVCYATNGDDVQVDSTITLSAWLYGSGHCRLKGGSGNNVLIGDGGGNLLVGGSGRDLIIGHNSDRLVSTGGQDILIAGSTIYDYDEVALGAIMAEWTSSDSLAARIANLSDNTASSFFSASRKNGNYFLIGSGPNATVFSDWSADTVTAGSGPDWIFASSWDKVTGMTAADVEFIFG
jgi:uncharacterized delta-60 repeat protein